MLVSLVTSPMLLMLCSDIGAQQAEVPRLGYLFGPGGLERRTDSFRQGLRKLGYIEGTNIFIEYRYAEGNFQQLPELAADLIARKVQIIVTAGGAVTRAAKQATSTIPIVMTNDPDPVGNGHAISLAKPGGNTTGLSTLAPELSGKRLEILREIIPMLSRVAVFGTSTAPGHAPALKENDLAGKQLGLKLQHLDILKSEDVKTAFEATIRGRADAILVLASGIVSSQRREIIELAAKHRLPVTYASEFVEAGGLMSFSTNYNELFQRAAIYVDKILKGAKPAELPIEQPKKFDLTINLNAAKQIGLPIPPHVLARADRVIR